MTKTWFITGCSTGFGREIAKAVLARGWNVVITARNPASVADMAKGYEATTLVLPLDVTHRREIAVAVKAAETRFGAIDVLVNNAGYGYRAAIEEGEDAQVRQMFDTNVFGLIDVTKAVLPGMRARRSGHIVNISSVGGRVATPGMGYYSATKFAVGGLSTALRMEVAPLGIKVTLIEPGPFRTDFAGRSMTEAATQIDDYAPTAGKTRTEFAARAGKQAGDPARAAQAIIKAVESDNPPLHLLLGAVTLQRIDAELNERRAEMEAWRSTTAGADFPA
jgi:NADP-dependent 3-hydroxy acid dehydrogenase YdfG